MKLSIDLGSTEFKAAIFADDMRLLGSAGHKLSYQRKGVQVELPLAEVDNAFSLIIRCATESAEIDLNDIAAIGITSQAQTFTIADGKGIPQIPFISWLDMRAADTCTEMLKNHPFANYATGGQSFAAHSSLSELSPGMQICLLRHLQKSNPAVFSQSMRIIPLPSYLIMLLTGNYMTDNNISAMSGFYSLTDNDYWQTALDYLRISRKNLPSVVNIGNATGTTRSGNIYDLPAGISVLSCGNDQTAGAYGADLKNGDTLITLGTALAVYCRRETMPEPGKNLFRGIYPGGAYYAMFADNGGNLISEAIKCVPEFHDFETFAKFASNACTKGGNSSLVFRVDKNTNDISWSDDDACLSDKAAAVLQYLSEQAAWMVEELAAASGIRGNVYLAGGGTRNKTWVEMIRGKINNIMQVETSPIHGTAKMI